MAVMHLRGREIHDDMLQWVEEQEIDPGSCVVVELATDGGVESARFHMRRPNEAHDDWEKYVIDVIKPTRPCPWPYDGNSLTGILPQTVANVHQCS